jgi:uroporphyrinogen III methyltransferase/synthase
MDNGSVYLVGAGPGDPRLVTLKAKEIISSADVIVYDRLIPSAVLEWARPDADLIYVGKSPDRHTMRQEEINELLVARARKGKVVCRLKGGDPFVFGRGGEEAAALAAAGVRFEVVPGVTSAVAGPAYAGIPVTHRGKASSVAFVTGHEDPDKPESAINWAGLATGTDTLVLLMGVGQLRSLAQKLIDNGRSPQTPAALIERATTASHRVVTGELGEIADLAEEHNVRAPALVVVGEVVSLRDELQWFEKLPLLGWRVLVTRTREQASDLSSALAQLGAEPVEVPVIVITDPTSYDALDQSLERVAEFDWLVLTSANGVTAVVERLRYLGMDIRDLKGPKVAAIGPGTAKALERFAVRVDLVPREFVAEALAEALLEQGIAGKRVLLARAEEARDVLPVSLQEAGAQVTVAPCYRTVPAEGVGERIRKLIESNEVDAITFASSSSVRAFVDGLAGQNVAELTGGLVVACIGPITAGAARDTGLHVDVVPDEYTIPGLAEALAEFAREHPLRRHSG